MNFIEMIALGASMAVDTMCAGASDGIKEQNIKYTKAISIALSFGIFQAGMAIIGYFLGFALKDTLLNCIPFIACAVMFLLALKTIIEAIKDIKEAKKDDKIVQNKAKKIGFLEIIFQSIATSIDALSVGFIYLSLPLVDAMVTFSVVGITTFVLSLLATILGKVIGSKIQKIAPFISAAIFLALSIKFLCEGLI